MLSGLWSLLLFKELAHSSKLSNLYVELLISHYPLNVCGVCSDISTFISGIGHYVFSFSLSALLELCSLLVFLKDQFFDSLIIVYCFSAFNFIYLFIFSAGV
jgi:hypothetical protein